MTRVFAGVLSAVLLLTLMGATRPPARRPAATRPAPPVAAKPAATPVPAADDASPEEDRPAIVLPGACTEFHAADGGRKIVFYFKDARKLLVADVLEKHLA